MKGSKPRPKPPEIDIGTEPYFSKAKDRDKWLGDVTTKKEYKLKRSLKNTIKYPKMNIDVLTERVKYLILTGEIKVWKSLQEFKQRKCNSTT